MTPAARVAVATGNRGKLREFRELLAGQPFELLGLDALPRVTLPDEGDDYAANAVAKARAVAEQAGLPAIGDDSGLEVAALDGAPGPHSARYGGAGLDDAGRVAHLLAELAAAAADGRRARFVCLVAWSAPDGATRIARGECRGRILPRPSGEGGFGYDPVFEPDEHPGRSMAELSADEKNRISHRARALAALLETVSGGIDVRAAPPGAGAPGRRGS